MTIQALVTPIPRPDPRLSDSELHFCQALSDNINVTEKELARL